MKKVIIIMLLIIGQIVNAQNIWVQKADFGAGYRSYMSGFTIGNKAYLGTGNVGYNTLYKDFWEYDPSTDVWTQKADFGGEVRNYAAGFSIGSKGYLGTGGTVLNAVADFWEYDLLLNTWTQKADFAGGIRQNAIAFSIGNKGYMGTGYTYQPLSDYRDFWEYDPSVDTWTRKTDFGDGTCSFAVGFSIGSKGYVGTGFGGPNGISNAFWEFDPVTDAWTQKADYGGYFGSRYGAAGFSIGSHGFIGTGRDYLNYYNDFWEYYVPTNTWIRKADVPPAFGREGCSGFSIGNKGYFAGGDTKLWEYSPDAENVAPSQLWGMTVHGGTYGLGTIFRMNPDGSGFNVAWHFDYYTGNTPNGSLIKVNNLLYGTTVYGGNFGFGVIFSFDPATNTYTALHNFNKTKGSYPGGTLLQASNGFLYGMTSRGGTNDLGVLFRFNLSNNGYTALINFDGTNGANPWHNGLTQAQNGLIYGTTNLGGMNNDGVLFSFNPDNSEYVKYDVNTFHDLRNPVGTLLQDFAIGVNGDLFGLTENKRLYSFTPYNFAFHKFKRDSQTKPHFTGSLTKGYGSIIYGMMQNDANTGMGSIFKYDANASADLIIMHTFTGGAADGASPNGSLTRASNGKFYGMTWSGGISDNGVVFRFNPLNNQYTLLHIFNGNDGSNPFAELVEIPSAFYTERKEAVEQVSVKTNIISYPNPANGRVTLKFTSSKTQSCELTIMDISGKIVLSESFTVSEGLNEHALNIRSFSKGVYFISARSAYNEFVGKIQKE